ncbi:methylenetetrahydrofolate reductase [NAD(P)H] [Clostridium tagluense]|uniref:methylenetetrahydrofolate reductase [NAD(P)H] n=1 Tax=Clostridium tagluense TaxID=360422 RepID=UPI001C6EC307|nr:methylenetetrahydrofolate reductase [NAD(P)H] [Clostridium tagluense]MBW9158223.1 methylenetetrahydrofolate reductase [NAD(P)H] [Clostridium tagluense]WLC66583.1 methylenetetrahydrofolate reductase [NAD(P)H] [Clostridium tagluense]
MHIKDLYKKKPVISLEIFPPKQSTPIDTIYDTIEGLKDLKPDFISVTYGAGGSSRAHTVEIANILKNKYKVETLAHLTCYNSTSIEIENILDELKEHNVENVLALRGDVPNDNQDTFSKHQFKHASDLVKHIKSHENFCIGGACYPEGHIECSSKIHDLKYLKAKVDNGLDFLITQIFFDNEMLYDFLERLDIVGIKIPISAGIMPVINKKQIERITQMCGSKLTQKFQRIIEKYEHNPEALKEAGIIYATEQVIDLLSSGIDGIHLYTMNKPEVARRIFSNISNIRSTLVNDSEAIG